MGRRFQCFWIIREKYKRDSVKSTTHFIVLGTETKLIIKSTKKSQTKQDYISSNTSEFDKTKPPYQEAPKKVDTITHYPTSPQLMPLPGKRVDKTLFGTTHHLVRM